ncbi:MAG: tetraacyldisaccharide 4'-kinase [Oceanococcaceae bacterium]
MTVTHLDHRSALEAAIVRRWYGTSPGWLWLLWPLERLFHAVVCGRRARALRRRATQPRVPVPVIVVGNIVVGGAGKTPVTMALVRALAESGWRPGIVSRGHGRQRAQVARVHADSTVADVGDEPLLLARETGMPVAVARDRFSAAQQLVDAGCDVIVADDGLQHYGLVRDIEIGVIPGARRQGNGHLLPVGPLRETPHRLAACDYRVVINGPAAPDEWGITARAGRLRPISGAGDSLTLEQLRGTSVVAIAAIAHPEAFFATLRAAGLEVEERRFPDHHAFTAADLQVRPDQTLVMTTKDAVKCGSWTGPRSYMLEYTAELPTALRAAVLRDVQQHSQRWRQSTPESQTRIADA